MLSINSYTDEEMIKQVEYHLEIIYRYTRENEADKMDKFLYQLMSEYLQMKLNKEKEF